MAAVGDIARILDVLPNSVEKIEALQELNTLLSTVHPSEVTDVVQNVSFNVVFECLETESSFQVQLTCSVLEKLLAAMNSAALLQQFHSELLIGLVHPTDDVKQLCLKQVKRGVTELGQEVMSHIDIICTVASCLTDDNLPVAQAAMNILTILAKSPDCLDIIFNAPVIDKLKEVSNGADVPRYRVYDVLVHVAEVSPVALERSISCGILQQLINELHKDDILIQLNTLELLKDLAMSQHGLEYLESQGVVTKLESMMENTESDPLVHFLLPGLVKFFGNIAHIYPKEILGRFKNFINIVFNMVDNPETGMSCVAIETLGHIGFTMEGKLALEKQGNRMHIACKRIGVLVKDSTSEVREKVLLALAKLIQLKVSEQTAELLMLTEAWFSSVMDSPMAVLLALADNPFLDLRCATFTVLQMLAMVPWGQHIFNNHPGFNEWLLNRDTEKSKEGKEAKYELVRTLVDSPTAQDIVGVPYLMRLKVYVSEGPFYLRSETSVAYEGET